MALLLFSEILLPFAAGMVLAYLFHPFVDRMCRLIERAGLPVKGPALGVDRYLDLMRVDKKNEGGEIRFVVIESLGRAGVRSAPDALVTQAILAHTSA